MAQSKKGASNAPTGMTVAELRNWYEQNKDRLDRYAKAKDALLNLRDVSKSTKLTFS